jgi:hypothetical protein
MTGELREQASGNTGTTISTGILSAASPMFPMFLSAISIRAPAPDGRL